MTAMVPSRADIPTSLLHLISSELWRMLQEEDFIGLEKLVSILSLFLFEPNVIYTSVMV